MIKGSKKIIMSVLTLTLTFIALGTITFAWFSLSTVSNISNISGEVRGAEGLQVRLVSKTDSNVKTNWRSHLTNDDVEDFIEELILNKDFAFDAVTTTNGKGFKKMDPKTSVVNADNAEANKDYLEFVIQFKSPTEGTVTLDEFTLSGNGKGGDSATFKSDNKYYQFNNNDEGNELILVDPSNGARFSLEETTGVKEDNMLAYQKKAETYEVSAVQGHNGAYVGNTANNSPVKFGQYSYLTDAKKMTLYYDDVNKPITLDNSGEELGQIGMLAAKTMDDVETFTELELEENTFGAAFEGATAEEFVGELTIRIWLEGWDPDTYDSLYEGLLELALVFSKE